MKVRIASQLFISAAFWVAFCCGAPQQAWAALATTTTLAVTSGGSPVTTVTSGSVVTLTATVTAGSTPVDTWAGELLRRHRGLLHGHPSAGNGAIDERGYDGAEVCSRRRKPQLQGSLCGDQQRRGELLQRRRR